MLLKSMWIIWKIPVFFLFIHISIWIYYPSYLRIEISTKNLGVFFTWHGRHICRYRLQVLILEYGNPKLIARAKKTFWPAHEILSSSYMCKAIFQHTCTVYLMRQRGLYLLDAMWLLSFFPSSSRCHWLSCIVWLWHFLVILIIIIKLFLYSTET